MDPPSVADSQSHTGRTASAGRMLIIFEHGWLPPSFPLSPFLRSGDIKRRRTPFPLPWSPPPRSRLKNNSIREGERRSDRRIMVAISGGGRPRPEGRPASLTSDRRHGFRQVTALQNNLLKLQRCTVDEEKGREREREREREMSRMPVVRNCVTPKSS